MRVVGNSQTETGKTAILKEKLMTCAHMTYRRRRLGFAAGVGLKRSLQRAWQGYWEWQRRRTTVRILSALDERTLRDIGISPSEITSYAYGDPEQRRRRCEASWRFNAHA
jgi:uncharacterized protein YjiS (DUF1127 family)